VGRQAGGQAGGQAMPHALQRGIRCPAYQPVCQRAWWCAGSNGQGVAVVKAVPVDGSARMVDGRTAGTPVSTSGPQIHIQARDVIGLDVGRAWANTAKASDARCSCERLG